MLHFFLSFFHWKKLFESKLELCAVCMGQCAWDRNKRGRKQGV